MGPRTALEMALLEANRIADDKTWAEIDHTVPGIARLSWGTIHSINGVEHWERAIASRRYEQRTSKIEIGPVVSHL